MPKKTVVTPSPPSPILCICNLGEEGGLGAGLKRKAFLKPFSLFINE